MDIAPLNNSEFPYPTICLDCGNWLDRQGPCAICGFIPTTKNKAFYSDLIDIDKLVTMVGWHQDLSGDDLHQAIFGKEEAIY